MHTDTIELTVDMVILVQRPDGLHVLVIRRGDEPFTGENTLPGGFVDAGETAEAAARRELREETGLVLTEEQADQLLSQLQTYTKPDRDPRGRVVSVDPTWFGVLAEIGLDLYGPRGAWTVVRLFPTTDHPEVAGASD